MPVVSHTITDERRWELGELEMAVLLRTALQLPQGGDLIIGFTCPTGADCSGETFDLDEVNLDVCYRVTETKKGDRS